MPTYIDHAFPQAVAAFGLKQYHSNGTFFFGSQYSFFLRLGFCQAPNFSWIVNGTFQKMLPQDWSCLILWMSATGLLLTGERQAGQAEPAITRHGVHQARPVAIPTGPFAEDRTKLAAQET